MSTERFAVYMRLNTNFYSLPLLSKNSYGSGPFRHYTLL